MSSFVGDWKEIGFPILSKPKPTIGDNGGRVASLRGWSKWLVLLHEARLGSVRRPRSYKKCARINYTKASFLANPVSKGTTVFGHMWAKVVSLPGRKRGVELPTTLSCRGTDSMA